VEPKIRRDIVEDCQKNLDSVDDQDELLRILAEWRRNENREWEFNRNSSTVENERNNIKTAEIRTRKEELIELILESEFKVCGTVSLFKCQNRPSSEPRVCMGMP